MIIKSSDATSIAWRTIACSSTVLRSTPITSDCGQAARAASATDPPTNPSPTMAIRSNGAGVVGASGVAGAACCSIGSWREESGMSVWPPRPDGVRRHRLLYRTRFRGSLHRLTGRPHARPPLELLDRLRDQHLETPDRDAPCGPRRGEK